MRGSIAMSSAVVRVLRLTLNPGKVREPGTARINIIGVRGPLDRVAFVDVVIAGCLAAYSSKLRSSVV